MRGIDIKKEIDINISILLLKSYNCEGEISFMYTSQYCNVKYNEEYKIVLVEWKKFCCYEKYRQPLKYALEIIKEKQCDYVADTRNGFENIPEDTQWVAEYFMPTAVEYG